MFLSKMASHSRSVNRLRTLVDHVQFGRVAANNVAGAPARHESTIPLVTADEWWGKCKKVKILEGEMSYYDSDPEHRHSKHAVVFLHGNPTSSYLWRNIIPQVEPVARCLAPDLIGQGRSSKLPGSMYRFVDHYQYLSAWFDSVNLPEKVCIVCHDWGSALGFHWSHQHQDRMEALVHMESLVAPVPGWDRFPDIAQKFFKSLRSPDGDGMVLESNLFVELLLPRAIMRELKDEEMEAYREPFKNAGEDRRPTLTWPREIPIMGDGPDDVVAIASAYYEWLGNSANLPKLFIDAEPGFFSKSIKRGIENWPNQKIVKSKGLHFLQEDSPIEIGDAIKDFLSSTVYK